jgi:hypothetical protein
MIMHSSKFVFVILGFLGIVCVWYLSSIESASKKAFLEVPDVKPIFENPCDYPQSYNQKIVDEEVIHLAECFVIQNGYTDLPPITDKARLTPENLFPKTDKKGMELRRDSLERKAFSYYQSTMYGGSWIVMFRYKSNPKVDEYYGERINHIGRAVIMDFYGKGLRIQHSDYPLRMPEAKIINQ